MQKRTTFVDTEMNSKVNPYAETTFHKTRCRRLPPITGKNICIFFLSTMFMLKFLYMLQFLPSAAEDNLSSLPQSEYWNPDFNIRINFFRDVAFNQPVITDKVTTHAYQEMYGHFLLPYYASHPKMKMLEIGLGCTVKWGPGESVTLWRTLFPSAERWEAEYDAKCVKDQTAKGRLDDISVLVGDQEDPEVLDGWIHDSGGQFDIVIDDGGHTNCQIKASFDKLWPETKEGGLYFIEDLMVGYSKDYQSGRKCDSDSTMSKILADWTEQLLEKTFRRTSQVFSAQKLYKAKYPLPDKLAFIHCQKQACVLGKNTHEFYELPN